MSHNLAREWVAACLVPMRGIHATSQSEWVSELPGFPEGAESRDRVHVYVTVPGSYNKDRVKLLVECLRKQADADPRLGGRFESAHLFDFRDGKDIEIVDSDEFGPEAKKLTLDFSVEGPRPWEETEE